MTYVIAEPCIGVKDRSCVDVCPVDCIYEGEDQLYIDPRGLSELRAWLDGFWDEALAAFRTEAERHPEHQRSDDS